MTESWVSPVHTTSPDPEAVAYRLIGAGWLDKAAADALRAEVEILRQQLSDLRALQIGEAGEWERIVADRNALRMRVERLRDLCEDREAEGLDGKPTDVDTIMPSEIRAIIDGEVKP